MMMMEKPQEEKENEDDDVEEKVEVDWDLIQHASKKIFVRAHCKERWRYRGGKKAR